MFLKRISKIKMIEIFFKEGRLYYSRMSNILQLVIDLVSRREANISDHGYDKLAEDDIFVRDVIAGVEDGVVVEDYPDYSKGPCVLVLQKDLQGNPIHVVWGIPRDASSPPVLVTAYRPDEDQWADGFMRRK